MKTQRGVDEEIHAIRKDWGSRLRILGHHYQRASVLRHADDLGDSLELSRKAASHPEAERIVFCGVRFMAESADILTPDTQAVYMPETAAGCPMADMADGERFQRAWDILPDAADWLPVVYVNSSAEVKAFCGTRGGSTCTSSNAGRVFKWALDQGKRIMFLPDEHLGMNTARDLGLPDEQIFVYDWRRAAQGGGMDDVLLNASGEPAAKGVREEARVIVWKGFCIVHMAFTSDHVLRVRETLPEAKIIVHPETPRDVVALCDAHGSTSQIIRFVEDAPDGSTVVIGTELNLIERLADEHRGRIAIKALAPSVCANMAKTNAQNLLAVLRDWPEDCRIRVTEPVAADAAIALRRMLEL